MSQEVSFPAAYSLTNTDLFLQQSQAATTTVLQQEYISCPVTAVAFYKGSDERLYMLAGVDGWLQVFDVHKSQFIAQLRIFDRQPIHGIHVRQTSANLPQTEPDLLIWGAQLVVLLPFSSLESLVQGQETPRPEQCRSPDWIYDALLSPHDGASGVLINAHTEVIALSKDQAKQGVGFGRTVSLSRPMLYSARLCWLSQDCVLVAAGTVFGEVIMWKCHLNPKDSSAAAYEVLFVFTGHEGSIFGVSISPEIEVVPGHKTRLVASCSDDRTIRVWDITERESRSTCNENDSSKLQEARETGFFQDEGVTQKHRNDSLRCVAVAMGHVSRIWHVNFGLLRKRDEGTISIGDFVLCRRRRNCATLGVGVGSREVASCALAGPDPEPGGDHETS
jgi:WD repeat-containing protein 6